MSSKLSIELHRPSQSGVQVTHSGRTIKKPEARLMKEDVSYVVVVVVVVPVC